LPPAEPEYLTDALRRCGALGDDRVCRVAVESSRATLLSRIIRLRLSYEDAAAEAPGSLILKTGLPERANAKWNSGRQEVAFYTQIAGTMTEPSVPWCFDAVWDADTSAWHLLLEPRASCGSAAAGRTPSCDRTNRFGSRRGAEASIAPSVFRCSVESTWLAPDEHDGSSSGLGAESVGRCIGWSASRDGTKASLTTLWA
jgi:hypothetical protein